MKKLILIAVITAALATAIAHGEITNKYWTATDYEVTNRFASYRQYGDVVIGFTHPVARDSFEARLMREPEFYRVLDLPSYAETVAAREAGKE